MNSDLPYRPAGGVTLVTDERLCRAAGEAIGHDLSPQSDPGNHRLVLLRVGATHYVVTGPFPDPQIHIILDSAFGKLREVVEAG